MVADVSRSLPPCVGKRPLPMHEGDPLIAFLGKLFGDCTSLHQVAYDYISRDQVVVDDVMMFWMGFPCKDVSSLCPSRATHRAAFADGDMSQAPKTGGVFKNGVLAYLRQHGSSMRVLILENVMGLAQCSGDVSPLDVCIAELRGFGLHCIVFKLQPNDFGFPQSRRWCLRPFGSTPNPYEKQRCLKAFLPRRAPRSLECITCPKVLQTFVEDSENKDTFERSLRSSNAKQAEWNAAVAELVRKVNAGEPIPRKRMRIASVAGQAGDVGALADVDDVDDSELVDGDERCIQITDGITLEAKECLGIFWPVKVRRATHTGAWMCLHKGPR